MSNLTTIPAIDGFETTLAQAWNGAVGTVYVDSIPASTFPSGEKTYIVVNPGKTNMQVARVSAWTAGQFTVDSISVMKGSTSLAYSQQIHAVKSKVIISDNYQFWLDIQTAINSKFDAAGGTVSGPISITGTSSYIKFPSLTEIQRDAIVSPANGMVIFNSTSGVNNQYIGGAWTTFASGTTVNMSTTVAGKGEGATIGEALAGTALGATGAPTVITGDIFLQAADLIEGIGLRSNMTIVASRAASAETIALKTSAGTDPSATDPIQISFRNATAGTGDYTVVTLTAATSITIPSTATMGATNSVPFRLWLVGVNDGGTFRLGLLNTQLSDGGIFYLQDDLLVSSTIMDTSSDTAGVYYTGTAVTAKSITILGYLDYTLAAVGTWGTAPTKIQIYRLGVKLPGDIVQRVENVTGETAGGGTALPFDNTIPQNSEGDQVLTKAIIPTSSTNKLVVDVLCNLTNQVVQSMCVALFQDSTAGAIAAATGSNGAANIFACIVLQHNMIANTTSSTTFNVRVGAATGASATRLNGTASNRIYGGVIKSYIKITEIMV